MFDPDLAGLVGKTRASGSQSDPAVSIFRSLLDAQRVLNLQVLIVD